MQMDTGQTAKFEDLEKEYGSKKAMREAGWEELPEDITDREVKRLQNRPKNRKQRRQMLRSLRRQKRREQ